MTAFVVSLLLRLGGSEPLFGIRPFVDSPRLLPEALVGNAEMWYDQKTEAMLFPFRSLAMLAGLILLPVVSRLTARWYAPSPLRSGTPEPTPS